MHHWVFSITQPEHEAIHGIRAPLAISRGGVSNRISMNPMGDVEKRVYPYPSCSDATI
jgi:hypothetical protein